MTEPYHVIPFHDGDRWRTFQFTEEQYERYQTLSKRMTVRLAEAIIAGPVLAEDETPDDGHTFRISVCSRMSSKVVGEPHHTDSPQFDDDLVNLVEVRAWSLSEALEKAALMPLSVWYPIEEGSDA